MGDGGGRIDYWGIAMHIRLNEPPRNLFRNGLTIISINAPGKIKIFARQKDVQETPDGLGVLVDHYKAGPEEEGCRVKIMNDYYTVPYSEIIKPAQLPAENRGPWHKSPRPHTTRKMKRNRNASE